MHIAGGQPDIGELVGSLLPLLPTVCLFVLVRGDEDDNSGASVGRRGATVQGGGEKGERPYTPARNVLYSTVRAVASGTLRHKQRRQVHVTGDG